MSATSPLRPGGATSRLLMAAVVVLAWSPLVLAQRGGRGDGPGQAAGRSSAPQAGARPGPDRDGPHSGPSAPGRGGDHGGGPGAGGPGAGGHGPGGNKPGPGGPGVGGPHAGAPGTPAARHDVDLRSDAKPAARPANARTQTQSMQAALVGRTQPFTPAWYAEHPTAWQAPHAEADCWTCAGTADVRGFLAVPVAPASGSAAPVPSTASTDPEWMPLGVFATAPHGAEQAHAYQQLAVSHSGALKGNYYDAVADAVHPITGSIDQATRKAAWTVGKGARFETTLDALLQTASDVTMKAGSSTQTWQLVQMDKPPSATAKP